MMTNRLSPTNEEQNEKLFTVHEIALQFRVKDRTVRRWIQQGSLDALHLPSLRNGQSYHIRQQTLLSSNHNPLLS